MGLIADAVVEMLTLPAEAIERPEDASFPNTVSGIARAGDRLILMLDLEQLSIESEGLVLPGDENDEDPA